MKTNYFIIILLLLSANLCAQDILKIEKVIQADSLNKSELYTVVNEWFAVAYNSANDVIQLADKESGKIIGKGIMTCTLGNNSSYNGTVTYTIEVAVRDSRFKVLLSNFTHSGKGISLGLITEDENHSTKGIYKNANNKAWIDLKLILEDYSNVIFKNLSEKTNKINNTEDDW